MEIIFFLKNRKSLLLILLFVFLIYPTFCAGDEQPAASQKSVVHFQGIGNKNGAIDTQQYTNSNQGGRIQEERESTITLSPGMQKFVDNAGNTINNINNSMRDSINNALRLLNVEAESAKLKASDDSVGVGISIKLDKRKKDQDKTDDSESQEGGSKEFYDTFRPSDSPREKQR